jgi:hypothetical protein
MEYSVLNRRQRPNLNQIQSANKEHSEELKHLPIKATILSAYDHFQALKSDTTQGIGYLAKTQDKISLEITSNITKLQKSTDPETTKNLSITLNNLNDLFNKLKVDYELALNADSEMATLKVNFPDIYDKITGTEPPARDTLEHVLTVFEQEKTGKLTQQHAVKQGIQHIKTKYQLPDDFFNQDGVQSFIDNIGKTNN